jgi:molybdopterin-containing oxidoreductase family iron-sulfur binding subunit
MDRRKFIKIAGFSLAGLTGQQGFSLFSRHALAKTPKSETQPALKRWAMAVNVDACAKDAGCRDCIDACHLTHNVPDLGNPKDAIQWIWNAPYGEVFPEQSHSLTPEALKKAPVPVLCNHCEDPPCVKVCPTKATWKREDGIVMMDYHRCIGCRYCMAACPYGARSFNWKDPRPFIKTINEDFPTRTKGVVEKCSFCEERLAKGLKPACVEACQENALIFGDLNDPDSEIARTLKRARLTIRRRPQLGTEPKVFYLL